ncbi:uncharacterized protein [Phyllobates terribilis]|uniref:uncharacterized protein n=1 Tax=Phyllobates terribilis TaxID=111132 RepID=UPI003CCB5EDD
MKENRLLDVMERPDEMQSIPTDFEEAINKVDQDEGLLHSDKLFSTILNKLQRPGVVQNMTAEEVEESVKVIKEQPYMNTRQSGFKFILKVQPTFLEKKINGHQELLHRGEKIHNFSTDISRFYKKFELKTVTSQEIRRNAETLIASNCKDTNDKDIFAKYLVHSNPTEERVYREKTTENMVKASMMTTQILHSLQEEPSTSLESCN